MADEVMGFQSQYDEYMRVFLAQVTYNKIQPNFQRNSQCCQTGSQLFEKTVFLCFKMNAVV